MFLHYRNEISFFSSIFVIHSSVNHECLSVETTSEVFSHLAAEFLQAAPDDPTSHSLLDGQSKLVEFSLRGPSFLGVVNSGHRSIGH